MQKMSGWMLMSPLDGAKTQLYAATSPEVDELNLKSVGFRTFGVD